MLPRKSERYTIVHRSIYVRERFGPGGGNRKFIELLRRARVELTENQARSAEHRWNSWRVRRNLFSCPGAAADGSAAPGCRAILASAGRVSFHLTFRKEGIDESNGNQFALLSGASNCRQIPSLVSTTLNYRWVGLVLPRFSSFSRSIPSSTRSSPKF